MVPIIYKHTSSSDNLCFTGYQKVSIELHCSKILQANMAIASLASHTVIHETEPTILVGHD